MKIKLSLFLALFFIVFDVHFNKYEKLLVLLSDAAYVISFCAGAYHACAVLDTYSVKCWGLKKSFGVSLLDDDFLGDDKSELGDSMPFVDVGEEVNAEQVACGEYHVCVKLDKGDVRCLGVNYDGQTGVGSNAEVVGIATGYSGDNLENVDLGSVYQVIGLALAKSHSCVVVTGNKVKCYGRNDVGQLGYGDTTKRGTCASQMGDDLPYLDLGTDVEIGSVHSGSSSDHTCAILSAPLFLAQRFKCWGLNDYYQLGYDDQINRGDNMSSVGDLLPLVDIGTESKVKQLALGKWHTCALLISNALKCWGFGGYGQLGSGSAETISSDSHGVPFVPIDSYRVISFVAAGTYHTCIVFDDMTGMRCFGHNGYGQLGQGDKLERGKTQTTMIKRIPNIDLGERKLKLTSIYLGNLFTCVIFKNSKIKCFGDNSYGQFAIGTNRNVGFGQKQMGGFLKSANIFETKSKHKKLSTAGVFAIIIALIAFLVMLAKCHIPYYFCMSCGDFYPSICCTRDSTSNSSNTSSNQARTQATVTDAAVDETVYTRLDSIPYAYPVETS